MIFHSLAFLIFLPAILALHWALPAKARNIALLVASYYFYGFIHPWFLILLGIATVIDYACALGIERHPERRGWFLGASIVSGFGMLGFFKYAGFFVTNVESLLRSIGYEGSTVTLNIFLPVGISFYTFQSVSYVVDVYRGHTKAATKLLDYALFVSFFPQLVAGPIERSGHLLPQVQGNRVFDPVQWRSGCLLLCWGFFKKLVIADNVAVTCNKVFALSDPSFPVLWAGVFAFSVQIFADFSAYTDIARGSAKMLGFDLMDNFRNPYNARTPSDFWRRWHISLSTWFRDYVYIPLGGSRISGWRTVVNLMLTFTLSGFWHGASWNFILWGLWWGLLVVLERAAGLLFRGRGDAAVKGPAGTGRRGAAWWVGRAVVPLQILGMFALTCFGWLLFRETDLNYLVKWVTRNPFRATAADWRMGYYLALLVFVYSVPVWIHHTMEFVPTRFRIRVGQRIGDGWGRVVLEGVGGAVLLTGILLLRSTTTSDFIYFQF